MEPKKKSTLSKAFSRFGRKSAPQSPTATNATTIVNVAPAPIVATPAPAPASAPAPAPAPVSAPNNNHIMIDTRPTNLPPATGGNAVVNAPPTLDTNGAGAQVISNDSSQVNETPFSPIKPSPDTASVSPPYSAGVSQMASPIDITGGGARAGTGEVTPVSPFDSTMHPREGTGMSNSSALSRQGGLSGSEDNVMNPEGGLNPADILLNRLFAYHSVVKNLQQYFTEIALVEAGISKAMHKASTLVVVPFKDGNQFLGKGGLQDVCTGVRESAKVRSDQHANATRFVEETVVKNIRRLKQDIKSRIKALKADANLYETRVFKEREATQERIASLAKAIGLFENAGGIQHDMEKIQSDPYVINISLRRQLARQVHEENVFARAFQQCQEQIMMFEKHIINEIKQILTTFAQYQLGHASDGFSQSWAPTEMALNVLQEDTEWNNFLELYGNRLFPSELVDADPEELDYPCKDSPYLIPIKAAYMSRRSSVLKNWKDGYFVLTQAGWLHVFASADPVNDPLPERSIYIPTAVLGPHTEPGHKQHLFSVDGKGQAGILHRDAQTFTLRANSREEMLEWWSEISKRAHSTTFTQLGDGHLEGNLSRSGSLMRSSTVKRSGSRAVRPQSPAPGQQVNETTAAAAPVGIAAVTNGAGSGTAAQAQEPVAVASNGAGGAIPATVPEQDQKTLVHDAAPNPAPNWTRHNTGSTVSLDTIDLPVLPVS